MEGGAKPVQLLYREELAPLRDSPDSLSTSELGGLCRS